MNENIRLTQEEIDTVVVGVGYNLGAYSAQLADARLIDLSLAKPDEPAATTENGGDGECDPATDAKKSAINAVVAAAKKTREQATVVIEKYPARALTASRITIKLLTGKPGNFTFTKEETDFVVDGLRAVENLDIEAARYTELVLNSVTRNRTHIGSAYSKPQTTAERDRIQTVRDNFLALYTKFVQHQRNFATAPATTANDQ